MDLDSWVIHMTPSCDHKTKYWDISETSGLWEPPGCMLIMEGGAHWKVLMSTVNLKIKCLLVIRSIKK